MRVYPHTSDRVKKSVPEYASEIISLAIVATVMFAYCDKILDVHYYPSKTLDYVHV